MGRTFGKRDATHAAIKAGLLRAGRPAKDVSAYGGFGCDIVTAHLDGWPLFLEIKREGPPHVRKLTESEEALRAMFPRFFAVAQTVEEALRAVGFDV